MGGSPGVPCSAQIRQGLAGDPGVDASLCVAEYHNPGHPTRVHPNRRGHYQVYPLLGTHGPQDSALVLELVLDSDPVVVDPYEEAHGKGESITGPLAYRSKPPRPCASCSHGYTEITSSGLGASGLNTN